MFFAFPTSCPLSMLLAWIYTHVGYDAKNPILFLLKAWRKCSSENGRSVFITFYETMKHTIQHVTWSCLVFLWVGLGVFIFVLTPVRARACARETWLLSSDVCDTGSLIRVQHYCPFRNYTFCLTIQLMVECLRFADGAV